MVLAIHLALLFSFADPAAAAEPPAGTRMLESGLLTISLEKVAACPPPAGDAPGAAAAPAGKTWVGFSVRTRSKAEELFITPRDFTLEKGGVILQPRHIDPPKLESCTPLLKPTQLRPKQGLAGFVLFEVPNGFRTAAAAAAAGDPPLVLAFKPTRWGGAKRLEFVLPGCLDTCTSSKPVAKKRARGARAALPADRR